MLAWDPSPDLTVVGYNVYYGTASRTYTCMVPVGNAAHALISGLQEGVTYFFAVTACNSLGLESLPSSEVSYTVPELRLAIQLLQTNGLPCAACITSGESALGLWTLEASPDLRNWSAMASGTNSTVNVAVNVQAAPVLFFRLKKN